ncbi:MAG: hypothetical protein NT040_09460, partial [Bacteroidetes bacterium]|nr:hypothetical protein [Bacteroidota bacterium]
LADTDRPFNCLLNVNNQLFSIIIATVMRLALSGVLHSPLRAHGALQLFIQHNLKKWGQSACVIIPDLPIHISHPWLPAPT